MTDATRFLADAEAVRQRLLAAGLLTAGGTTCALRVDAGRYVKLELCASADVQRTDDKEKKLAAEAAAFLPLSDNADPLAGVFRAKPDARVVLLLAPPGAREVSDTLNVLRASLDDMAQIVGVTARVAKAPEPRALCAALVRRNACFVRGRGMLVTGRSVGEAVTAAILLEKAARTELLARRIGGARPVPLLAALLMHAVYQKKYSAINLAEEAKRGMGE